MKKYIVFTISLVCFYFVSNLVISLIVNAAFQPEWLGVWSKGQQVTGAITLGLLHNPIDLISLILSLVISIIISSKYKTS